MKRKYSIIVLILISSLMAACTPKPEQVKPYVDQTLAAWPTQTPYATYTSVATYTAMPTYTKGPTLTGVVKIVTATFTSTPRFTPTETPIPTDTPVPTATSDPLKSPKTDGFYLVNVDIAPGVWRSNGSQENCYWAVTTATGGILDNHFGMAGGTMYVPANGFQVELDDCGTWTWLQP
ncbi:MAG: hypothetical protein WA116_09670 [Anaerolineaceae bacterium]